MNRSGRLAGATAVVLLVVVLPADASRTAVRARNAYWSAGGQVIAFWDGSRLWTMNADGTRRRPIAPLSDYGAGDAELSPSGRLVAITDDQGRPFLVVKRVGGPILRRIRWRAGAAEAFFPVAWSPNERAIAMGSFAGAASDRIFVADLRNGRVRKLRRARPGADESPAWSPDSRRIAFSSCALHDPCYFALMAPDGQNRRIVTRKITAGVDPVAWAPDGRAIAVARPFGPTGGESQRWGIYVVRLRTRSVQRVAATPMIVASELSVVWSPDGRHLALSDTRGVSVAHVSGRRQTLITSRGRRAPISWAPSNRILFVNAGAIYTVLPRERPHRVFP
jgi:Tol biopolymer transport system component